MQLTNAYFTKVSLMYGYLSSVDRAFVVPPVKASMFRLKASDQLPLMSSSSGWYDHTTMNFNREALAYLKNFSGPQELMREVLIGVDAVLDESSAVPTVPIYGQFCARVGGIIGLFSDIVSLTSARPVH